MYCSRGELSGQTGLLTVDIGSSGEVINPSSTRGDSTANELSRVLYANPAIVLLLEFEFVVEFELLGSGVLAGVLGLDVVCILL